MENESIDGSKYQPDRYERQKVKDNNIVRIVGFFFLLFAVVLGGLGFLNTHQNDLTFENFSADFYANISTELASIAITVLIIDFLNQRREQLSLKGQLMREMGSEDNSFALRAVVELRVHGWLEDGTLKDAYLRRANLYRASLGKAVLSGAFLRKANLTLAYLGEADLRDVDLIEADLTKASFYKANLAGANLSKAILKSTKFTEANLVNAILPENFVDDVEFFEKAIMPNGEYYEEWVQKQKEADKVNAA